MDAYQKLYWYESWQCELETNLQNMKSQAILIGSFTNYEMAKKIAKQDSPDIVSDEEGMNRSWQMVEDEIKAEEAVVDNIKHRRKRKLIRNG